MIANPAHPGEVLKDYLEAMTIAEAASRLGVTRAHLSRIGEWTRGNIGRNVLAALRGAWHLAPILAKNAAPIRPLAGEEIKNA
jgi:hypothetical protein